MKHSLLPYVFQLNNDLAPAGYKPAGAKDGGSMGSGMSRRWWTSGNF